jgi:hypothetical protein
VLDRGTGVQAGGIQTRTKGTAPRGRDGGVWRSRAGIAGVDQVLRTASDARRSKGSWRLPGLEREHPYDRVDLVTRPAVDALDEMVPAGGQLGPVDRQRSPRKETGPIGADGAGDPGVGVRVDGHEMVTGIHVVRTVVDLLHLQDEVALDPFVGQGSGQDIGLALAETGVPALPAQIRITRDDVAALAVPDVELPGPGRVHPLAVRLVDVRTQTHLLQTAVAELDRVERDLDPLLARPGNGASAS